MFFFVVDILGCIFNVFEMFCDVFGTFGDVFGCVRMFWEVLGCFVTF